MELAIIFIIGMIIVIISVVSSRSSKDNSTSAFQAGEGEFPSIRVTVTTSTQGGSGYSDNKPNDYKWIPPGESVTIANLQIPGGMIYCGKHLKSISDHYMIEPSFINASLPIDLENPDSEGNNLNYWPSYSSIPQSNRAAYLLWLAGGRVDTNINIGYVFIFFYGLERRLLNDTKTSNVSHDEIQAIYDELRIMRQIYGPLSSSFNHYVNGLIEVVELGNTKGKFYDLAVPLGKFTYELSPIIKLALGQLALEGKPLTAKWIFQYVLHHPDINLRTPAKRCPGEFKKLFEIWYAKKFKDGIIIKPNKTKVKLNYHCGNAGLSGLNYNKIWDIPDVSILKSLLNKILPIVEVCQNDLDRYSRWLGQHPGEEDSIIAFSLLPDELASVMTNKKVETFRGWLNNSMDGAEDALINNKELIDRWQTKNDDRMLKSETLSFISFLEKMKYGIEPDVRFGGTSIKAPGKSVIFKLHGQPVSDVGTEYLGEALLIHIAAVIAKADGKIEESERSLLLGFINKSSALVPEEKHRMKALLTWHLNTDISTKGLKKQLEPLEREQKLLLAEYIVSVAGADGYISPEEVKMLTKLYNFLGFEAKDLYSHIHLFEADKTGDSEEPVMVRASENSRNGYSIPAPEPVMGKQGIDLDMGKIKNIQEETKVVVDILGKIFTEEEPQEEIVEQEPVADDTTESLQGLDANHTAVLLTFEAQKVWAREEFEKLTSKYDLLPDGALETLNERSLEVCDENLCEGDDPIIINQEVYEELMT